jgi:hypothetical protein
MTSRSWSRRGFPQLLALGFAASGSRLAQAATLSATFLSVPDCSATGGGWACYLPGILRFLSVIAIILAVILVGVIALVIRSYLRMKNDQKLEEDDEKIDS